ncbi:NHLP bacteriocin export ABC transporter permease/ATPase subunit [uncultured Dokdonia sp.]|uniref:NHLP bacteriocin export ABC transporter permease/ATPase subunit n=1 Tax=uncultured Dokdonia sp. TaxID=575653 RepID=UPI00263376B2|nr:NHLP bacteriocin export ABC transporter permease/ATPase subunit [uncultured Dokdonia sp.]
MTENKKINIGASESMILDSHDKFWMVISGEVDIFYVNIDANGNYKSRLTYLYRAKKGELLFSLLVKPLKEGIRLLAMGSEAKLLELDKNKLIGVDHTFLKFHIEKWISNVTERLHRANIPRVYTQLENKSEIVLSKDEIGYPYKGIVWCKLTNGSASIYGGSSEQHAHSSPDFHTVVSNSLWVKALEKETAFDIVSTREMLKDEIYFMLSLKNLQTHFYKKIIEDEVTSREQEKQRIVSKIATDGQKLNKTLRDLGGIIPSDTASSKSTSTQGSSFNTDSDLFAACQAIGDKVGFDFKTPKYMDSYKDSLTNQLFAIGQASNVRIRKIILRGTWWKDENGHILAFTKEGNHSVALIQKTAQSYSYKNPETGVEETVTNTVAESLEPVAYMFFFAFDKKMDAVKKIWEFAIQGVKKDAKFLILAALSGSLIGLLVPILSGVMFDDVIPTADRGMLIEVFAIMLMIGIVSALLQLVQGVLQLRVETKSNLNLQGGVMDHLLRLPVSFYKKYSSGDLTNRALSINTIRQILSNTVLTAVLSGTFSIVNLGLLFYYDTGLAWIGVGLAVIAVIFIASIGWLKLQQDRDISNEHGAIQGFLFEFLSGITKIRITGAEKRIFTLWATKFSRLKKLGFKSGSYQNYIEVFNASYPLMTKVFFFSFIYYVYTTATTASVGLISVGAFMAFMSAFSQFLGDALRMSMSLISSLNIITLYERVQPILEETPESSDDSVDPGELAGGIELNSVSFRYNEEQPLVLNDVSLKINPGEMVAFIGPSGSGKSTVMRVLLGFEEPEAGSVYYDGNAFDSMNKDLVRRQIGVVLQNGALMAGSIYKNIVGNSELSLDDAWEAARMAGMEEDIKNMPMEMHTMVSESGSTFSGGQRQRLMIARAIAHKPRLLYMDEATSALDNHTQNIVSESLDNLQATRIVIAHRLSTIRNADRIYVMDKGTIVESGTYDELIENDGLFSTLAKRQIA